MTVMPSRQAPAPWRQVTAVAGLALGVLVLLAWAVLQGRPVPLPDAGDLRVPCLSYAPFRRPGHAPSDPALHIEASQIEADLRQLREMTGCVRTYGVDHGLDAVPAIARKLGMRVVLGAWIDGDAARNAAQLQRALALARDYADVIDLLVIGNEVLLRGEQTPAALASLLARAKHASSVPIAYADVWAFWLRHADALRDHVDVVAAHVLPYWEDNPVALNEAIAHVSAINARLQAVFAPLPVFIGETGWPAAGRQRGAAIPGRLQQTRFVRELLAADAGAPLGSETRTWPSFNLIEGFDQPWKRRQEGAMGGYWGVFDADGRQRVSLHGPVVADPHWWRIPLAMVVGSGASLLWTLRRGIRRPDASGTRRRRRVMAAAATGLAGSAIGALTLLQWQMLVDWSHRPLDWLLGGSVAVAAGLCALLATARLGRILDGDSPPAARPGVVAALRTASTPAMRGLALAQAALLGSVVLIALGLLFDGRYRPLVWPLLAAPASLLLALTVLGDRVDHGAWLERTLATVAAVAAVWLVAQEGPANTQALGQALIWLGLAAAVCWPQGLACASGSDGGGR
jgi:exo-beta-1,3-glucanase (GH17 family)